MVDPSIFKAYDVRGTYPDQMDEEVAYRVGRAFAQVLSQLEDKPVADLRVAIGRDMRLSAPAMAARYAQGLTDEGVDVLDVGMAGTEMVYWTVGSRGTGRRAHVHRLPQPEGLHRGEAGAQRRPGALRRLRNRRAPRPRGRR